MFQTPVACLMHLDSQIVQIDTYSKYLLVSTLTRTLFCDTETEKYRQVGKKTRDGNFGACFVTSSDIHVTPDLNSRTRGLFQILGESEQLSAPLNDDKVKIYCARPGVRLWQADFQANVVVTHQFRPSLGLPPTKIVHCDNDQLKIRVFDSKISENFNFGKIYNFLNCVLTFRSDGFYIFNPSLGALQYWSHLSDIKDVKIVNSFLFIWHKDLEVSVLSLLSIEELVLRSLMRKKYNLCGEICIEFLDQVEALVETSKKIYLITVLESKLEENSDVLLKLKPILNRLKESARTPNLERFKNGIVTVNALPVLPETVENFQIETDKKDSILLEQFRVNKIHKTIETQDFSQFIKSLTSNELYDVITNFEKTTEESAFWCKEMYLKYLKVSDELKSEALNYANQAFFEINPTKNLLCDCSFPFPEAHNFRPKYREIGAQLMEKCPNYDVFVKSVPYMYRYVLEKIGDFQEFQLKLPLIIQFSEPEILEIHSDKFTYDLWDDSVRYLLKLKSGQCLNCGARVEIGATFDWTNFGLQMIESIKGANALKLFKRYANLLPKGELKPIFYQYCIFSSASNIQNSVFRKTLNNESVCKQVGLH